MSAETSGPTARAAERLAELVASLRALPERMPSALALLPAAFTDALGCEQCIAFDIEPKGEGAVLGRSYDNTRGQEVIRKFGALISETPIGWTTFNPLSPEPAHRNRVLTTPDIVRIAGLESPDEILVYRTVYRHTGLDRLDTLRLVITEGPSMLGWVGLFRHEPFTLAERRLVQEAVGSIRRRLYFDHLLRQGGTASSLFERSFDAIPAPAFVLDDAGALVVANGPGRLWLDHEGAGADEQLARALRHGRDLQFRITPVARGDARRFHLAVLQPGARPDAGAAVATAAARWRCTARQQAVLRLIVDGLTNRVIAAELKVSEKAVEKHLTALYERAQVENRTELVVAVWRQQR